MVRGQVRAVPAKAQSPPQPPKVESPIAVAVRVTGVPLSYKKHPGPQSAPKGLGVTVPLPVPTFSIVRANLQVIPSWLLGTVPVPLPFAEAMRA